MKSYFIILLSALFIFLTSCKKNDCLQVDLELVSITGIDENEIVNTIFNESFQDLQVHLNQESLDAHSFNSINIHVNTENNKFDSITLVNYVELNSTNHLWGSNLLNESLILIHKDELKCLVSENNSWKSYFKIHSDYDGYLSFGKPIINQNNEAIIEYSFHCGFACASGYVATLKKENGQWKILRNIKTWIT